MKKERKDKIKLIVSLVILGAVLLFFLIAPHFLHHDPYETDLGNAFLSPGQKGFILGTDQLGRCMICRLIVGGQQTLFSSLFIVAVVFVVGSLLGMFAGYQGGVADSVIMKITTVFQAFPSFVLAVAIAGILGPGKGNGLIAMMLVSWTTYTRYARSLVLNLKNEAYVGAAKMCHAGKLSILVKYLLPNMLSPLLVTAALDIGNVVLSMAGLSFIGLGGARPTAEWGAVMSEAKRYLQTEPMLIIYPGIALLIVVFLFNFCSDSLRSYLDKRGPVKN